MEKFPCPNKQALGHSSRIDNFSSCGGARFRLLKVRSEARPDGGLAGTLRKGTRL
jgi:hypothetical protein